MACRLAALNKCPGVRPLGIGEVWRRAIAKCALKACGDDAKAACGSLQLCAGLEAGIEGAINAALAASESDDGMIFDEAEVNDDIWMEMAEDGELQEPSPQHQVLREARAAAAAEAAAAAAPPADAAPFTQPGQENEPVNDDDDDDPELLLMADAKNAFCSLGKMGMLWTVRHIWPKMSRLAFNCYRHQIQMVCRQKGAAAIIILAKEGVAQGNPLAMALYGVGLVSLIRHLMREHPDVLQAWFADDGSGFAKGSIIAPWYRELGDVGQHFGYYLEFEKSIAVCPLADEPKLKALFANLDLPVTWTRGQRHVGGFVGSTAMQDRFVEPKVADWVHGVEVLAKISRTHPQTAYHGFTMSLQAEWQYMARVVPGLEAYMQPVEDAIQQSLIPALLGVPVADVTPDFRLLLANGVKQGGLNIRNPIAAAPRSRQSSVDATATLVKSLMEHSELDSVAHRECVKLARLTARSERILAEVDVVDGMKVGARRDVVKRLDRIGSTGAWLTAMPDCFNGTLLSCEEMRDNLRLRYGMRPLGLQDRCDGCGKGFSIEHGLNCKKGGLVGIHHNDVRDEAGGLLETCFAKTYVSYEPPIFQVRACVLRRGRLRQPRAAAPPAAARRPRAAAPPATARLERPRAAAPPAMKRAETCCAMGSGSGVKPASSTSGSRTRTARVRAARPRRRSWRGTRRRRRTCTLTPAARGGAVSSRWFTPSTGSRARRHGPSRSASPACLPRSGTAGTARW